MAYPSINFEWTPGQTSLCYIVFRQEQLPRKLMLEYWTNPHATLVARTGGLHQYRTHVLNIARTACWPAPVGVQTTFPDGWTPDGVVEATVLDTSAFAPTPILQSVLEDEQNFLRRGLAYMTRPNGSLWHRDILAPATSDLQRPETRLIALLRRRIGVTEDEFASFIQSELAAAITSSEEIVETKTMLFAPYNESVWPSAGLSHAHPEGQQYHAAAILAGCNRLAVEKMFHSKEFKATLPLQSELLESIHCCEVDNSISMVEDGELQPSALRGFAIAQILSRIGATSQTEEPVLSQVLSVPNSIRRRSLGSGEGRVRDR